MLISLSLQGAVFTISQPQRNNPPTTIPTSRRQLRAATNRGWCSLGPPDRYPSCSTSSSTHAPTSAFSRVMYDSNGNFMLRVLPSECRMARWSRYFYLAKPGALYGKSRTGQSPHHTPKRQKIHPHGGHRWALDSSVFNFKLMPCIFFNSQNSFSRKSEPQLRMYLKNSLCACSSRLRSNLP